MIKVKLALDWTPNINHIGFFIAKELGFYSEQDIELIILDPKDDNYAMTPGKKLELNLADFAIAPFETVISLNNKPKKVRAIAVFAILQQDLSAIATLKKSNINTPKLLDGATYASYKARYEDHIVKQMIKNDGGKGEIKIIYPEKLGIWNTLLQGKADATWIFDNWEGIEAVNKKVDLHKFTLNQYDIPYGYSPIVLTKQENLTNNKLVYSNFIKATQKGFLFVKDNAEQAKSILQRYLSSSDLENIDIAQSIAMTTPHFGDESNCGMMKTERVLAFTKWLVDNRLEESKILEQRLFTNELFEKSK
ncbi:MAG: ABC transporter substrate-binding protein [Bernardetiaceae bacterium]|nr:ABC transporter substrate-binding protein [Bernardetiaceae bacterium]